MRSAKFSCAQTLLPAILSTAASDAVLVQPATGCAGPLPPAPWPARLVTAAAWLSRRDRTPAPLVFARGSASSALVTPSAARRRSAAVGPVGAGAPPPPSLAGSPPVIDASAATGSGLACTALPPSSVKKP